MKSRVLTQWVRALVLLVLLALSAEALAQGFVPMGRSYRYKAVSGTVRFTHEFAMSFEDSTLYAGVDTFIAQRDDVIRSAWSRSFQDSLVQWFRNSNSTDPNANQVQLVGFKRPGLRVFYEPPLPWVPSLNQLSVGDSTWSWRGQVWPTTGTGLPDSLVFTAQLQEQVTLADNSTRMGWRIRVEGAPSISLASGVWVDLSGRLRSQGAAKVTPVTTSWYGAYNDGDFHWLLLRDDLVELVPDISVPVVRETMGSLRGRFRAPPSGH